MSFPRLLPLLFLAFLLTAFPVRAQLTWDHAVQEFQRVPEDKEILAHYTFHNNTASQVTIKTLRPSCGCTTAHLEKKVYAPNESGEVVVRFIFGDRKGLLRKTVAVTTDDKT